MKEQFVTYEIAKQLKKLGFDERCFGLFNQIKELCYPQLHYGEWKSFHDQEDQKWITPAPLWQQVVDWLREEKDIQINIVWNKFYPNTPYEFEVRPIWRDEPVRPYGIGGMESTYYKSLERAIREALKMIDKKEFKKGGDLKDNSKNKNMSTENEFIEIADYGDQMYFTRDFGQVIVGDDEKEIPLVLVATIENFYEATGDDRFEEKPFIISLNIYPSIEFIDKAHIESCADSAGINADEVGYTDLVSYGLGIPLNLKNLEEGYVEMNDAEEFLKSKELKDQLNAQSMLIGFYMDGAINRAGDSRWAYLEHSLDKSKSWN